MLSRDAYYHQFGYGTSRCFLRCLQGSSSSSLLFSIEFWSAVRITSFSVRQRSHARPPLENACPVVMLKFFINILTIEIKPCGLGSRIGDVYTAKVYRDLQGLCGGFLQYLQGKLCNIYRFSLQSPCNL